MADKNQEQIGRYTQVIIAALNEEEGIGFTISEISHTLGNIEVIVVDGKSSDRTVEVAEKLGARIAFQDGLGKGDALVKGIQLIDPQANYIVFTDADYTYPAKRLPDMIKILEEKPRVGMVCGNRFNGHIDPKALHSIFEFGNRLIAFTHNFLLRTPLRDPLTGLRVVRAEILRNWKVKSKGFDIEVELNNLVKRQGFDIEEVEIEYRERLGKKKLTMKNGAEIFKRIFLEATY